MIDAKKELFLASLALNTALVRIGRAKMVENRASDLWDTARELFNDLQLVRSELEDNH